MSTSRSFSGIISALQLADSFFPSGAYTLSHGLETAVEDGLVRSPDDLERWLRVQIEFQVAPTDGNAVVQSWRAARANNVEEIVEIDRRLAAYRLVAEAREASRKVGRRLLTTVGAMIRESAESTISAYATEVREGRAPGQASIALAVSCEALDVGLEVAVMVAFYSFSSAVLGAALRSMRVDHQATQSILFRLQPIFIDSAYQCLEETDQGYWTGAPLLEISAMRHRRALRRSFMT